LGPETLERLTDSGGQASALCSERLLISAATLVELGIALETRLGPVGSAVIERFLRASHLEVIGVDHEIAHTAVDGWRRFGKGKHPAGLNYGDSFVYAVAANLGASVLCVGDDFGKTDVAVVDLT
jgi:ribonuclease VapC